jgi:large subunit ribosomal protein L4e
MTSRPVVSVYTDAKKSEASLPMPAVFTAPIRQDIVHFVHSNMAKNRRQAHSVFYQAGKQHSAESWGTGRAVARIPRISGSGTHRSGQAAFGNMCRKGHMYAPLKVWRKWHRKINTNQKRHAVAAAIAASAVTPLVMARGHAVEKVPEFPLVVDSLNSEHTKNLLAQLVSLGVDSDLKRVRSTKRSRAGQGKYRNSRYIMRKGPLIIYGDDNKNVHRAARNLSGVDTCHVSRINLLQLCPGGHLGRFLIWTKDAFKALGDVFGSYRKASIAKKGYHLQRHAMDCADLARLINSDQVQAKLRQVKTSKPEHYKKKNPLRNKALMKRLNPYDVTRIAVEKKLQEVRHTKKAAALKLKRKGAEKKARNERRKSHAGIQENMKESFKVADKVFMEFDAVAGDNIEE